MCRRELPTSAGALPARLAGQCVGDRLALPPVPSSTRDRRKPIASRSLSDLSLPGTTGIGFHQEQLKVLPSRLGRQVIAFVRRGSLRLDGFDALLDCAVSLTSFLQQGLDQEATQAAVHAKEMLSTCASQALSEMPMVDARSVLPKLAKCMQQSLLVHQLIFQGMQSGALKSVQMSGDDLRGRNGIRWQEAECFIDYAMSAAKYEVFGELLLELAPHAARLLFDAVQLAPLEQMPVSLRRASQLAGQWQGASLILTAALRPWLLPRLQQLASKAASNWGEEASHTGSRSEPTSPLLPPSSRRGGFVATAKGPLDVIWWLEVLRAAAINGLLENSPLLQLCESLEVGFTRAGIKIVEADRVLRNQATLQYAYKNNIGSPHVARALAPELAARPASVRYLTGLRLIVYSCPSLPTDTSESIVLSLDSESKDSCRGLQSSPMPVSTSSGRGRPPRPGGGNVTSAARAASSGPVLARRTF